MRISDWSSDVCSSDLRITRDVAERFQPGLWNALPEFVRKRLVQRVQAELPDLITEIMGDVRDHIDRLFDLKTMVVSNMVRDKKLLNRIFSETGKQEFTLFGTAGFYFGFGIDR